ncbi:FIG149030: hypothetical protein [hydrothermal vent metagenome]|uniref:Flagellar protein FliT n=1 Tax=hydrothermal vent metagenome TaxID=652676 RepID=A0A3B0YLA4_9ZZZZ
MFFSENRKHFFRPLLGKYREQVLECLRVLHARLYGTLADYNRAFTREQVLEGFQEAITRTPALDEDEDDFSTPVRSEREQANWILNLLLEHGWIECHADEATLQSSYAFSRVGRLFTQPMVETAGGGFRTRHRNTRNTRNALQSFLERGEVYDLLDAYEYSERIISDFSDVIAELDERKRMLVREVEAQQVIQQASDEFFDFMEKRFIPDLSVRLSADSVEKYRDEIQSLIGKARRKQKAFKAGAERELRKLAPELLTDKNTSLYLLILENIESRIHSASDIMLPALRKALHGFTRRADIIIRQLSYTLGGEQGDLLSLCQQLGQSSKKQQQLTLDAAADAMATLNLGLVDPTVLRLFVGRQRRVVNTTSETHTPMSKASRRELFIQQSLQKAFMVNNQQMGQFILSALKNGHRIHSNQLPVHSARDLLMAAHAIEAGAVGLQSSEFQFRVQPTGQRVQTDYFQITDDFIIELVEQNHAD